jgi:hypothetical protein
MRIGMLKNLSRWARAAFGQRTCEPMLLLPATCFRTDTASRIPTVPSTELLRQETGGPYDESNCSIHGLQQGRDWALCLQWAGRSAAEYLQAPRRETLRHRHRRRRVIRGFRGSASALQRHLPKPPHSRSRSRPVSIWRTRPEPASYRVGCAGPNYG